METPWGDTDVLRRSRLHPGTQPRSREATERHQRERLFGAMVAAVAERGYTQTTVEDVARISGVAVSSYYRLFDNKQGCFLAALDELYANGMKSVEAAYRRERGWERQMRAAFAAVIAGVVSQPAAARMGLVEIYEAGEEGRARAERGAAGFERLMHDSFARSPERAGLPKAVPRAIVGAGQMLIHDRLRRDAERELPKMMDELAAWALTYRAASVPLRRSGERVSPARPGPPADAGERLLLALAEASAEKGYRAVSVNELAPRARTTLSTLYERFGGKEQCFLACLELVRKRGLAIATAAYESRMPDWPRAIRSAIEALFRYFASEPDLARVAIVEVLAAGPPAVELRDGAIGSFAALLDSGYERAPKAPQVIREAVPLGLFALLHRHLGGGREAATLPRLAPAAGFFVLAPFIGAERATEVANEKVPAPPVSAPTTEPVET